MYSKVFESDECFVRNVAEERKEREDLQTETSEIHGFHRDFLDIRSLAVLHYQCRDSLAHLRHHLKYKDDESDTWRWLCPYRAAE